MELKPSQYTAFATRSQDPPMHAKAPVRRRNAVLDHVSDKDFAQLEPLATNLGLIITTPKVLNDAICHSSSHITSPVHFLLVRPYNKPFGIGPVQISFPDKISGEATLTCLPTESIVGGIWKKNMTST